MGAEHSTYELLVGLNVTDAERYAAGIIERETGTRPERVSGPQMSSAFWREAGREPVERDTLYRPVVRDEASFTVMV